VCVSCARRRGLEDDAGREMQVGSNSLDGEKKSRRGTESALEMVDGRFGEWWPWAQKGKV
jgi:hypothetical protein